MAEPVPGLTVSAALTRMDDDVELDDEGAKNDHLVFHRIDFIKIITDIEDEETLVFFCGSGAVNRILSAACAARGLRYFGSDVE